MRKMSLLAAAAFVVAGPVMASQCPGDMKKIDEALAKSPKLSATQLEEVKKQRAEGETLHKAGKHKESVEVLSKAMKTLNVK